MADPPAEIEQIRARHNAAGEWLAWPRESQSVELAKVHLREALGDASLLLAALSEAEAIAASWEAQAQTDLELRREAEAEASRDTAKMEAHRRTPEYDEQRIMEHLDGLRVIVDGLAESIRDEDAFKAHMFDAIAWNCRAHGEFGAFAWKVRARAAEAEVTSLTAIRERLEHTLRWIVEADYDPADPVSTLATWLTARTSAEHALGILGAAPSPERYACPECGAERNGVEPCANCGNRDAAAPSPEPRCEFCTDLVADHTPDELASCDADLRAAAPSPEGGTVSRYTNDPHADEFDEIAALRSALEELVAFCKQGGYRGAAVVIDAQAVLDGYVLEDTDG